MKNIVILLSGRGSNFEAILRTARAENWEAEGLRIAAVFSNRPDAKGLATARAEGLDAFAVDHKAFATREAFDEELARGLHAHPDAGLRFPLGRKNPQYSPGAPAAFPRA